MFGVDPAAAKFKRSLPTKNQHLNTSATSIGADA
jgi:hypothetical protein